MTVVSSIVVSECMESLFRNHRPQYVFHAAAYKHVPMMEVKPTFHPKIKIAAVREYPYEEALRHEEELLEIACSGDAADIVSQEPLSDRKTSI